MTRKKTDPDELLIGLASISDRASGSAYQDQGLPVLRDWFTAALSSPWHRVTRLIPDERAAIEQALIAMRSVQNRQYVRNNHLNPY